MSIIPDCRKQRLLHKTHSPGSQKQSLHDKQVPQKLHSQGAAEM